MEFSSATCAWRIALSSSTWFIGIVIVNPTRASVFSKETFTTSWNSVEPIGWITVPVTLNRGSSPFFAMSTWRLKSSSWSSSSRS